MHLRPFFSTHLKKGFNQTRKSKIWNNYDKINKRKFTLGNLALAIILSLNVKYALIEGSGLLPIDDTLSLTQRILLGRRAAIVDAYRNALIYQKRFDKKKWQIKPYQKINISGIITGARIVSTRLLDNRVTVTIRIPANAD
jgi:hypothetical protein